MLKVAMVAGSLPPDACGIGDYAQTLAKSLAESGMEVACFGGEALPRFWGRNGIFSALRAGHFDLIHLQYPAMRYGRSLMPALLPLRTRSVPLAVTIHEFTSFKRIRRPWFLSFAHFADLRIFTSDRERSAFSRCMRPTRGRDVVIPIGSNIGRGKSQVRHKNSICNFGLICPGKGLESFLDFAELCRGANDWPISLIGAETVTDKEYANAIIARARRIGVTLHLNLPESEVADLLAAHEVAYLPFPCGATTSRGSLLAALKNGTVVVTKHSDLTSSYLKETTIPADTPGQAFDRIATLLKSSAELENRRIALLDAADDEWRAIAAAHVPAFQAAIANSARPWRSFGLHARERS